jgi:hypothetical protein
MFDLYHQEQQLSRSYPMRTLLKLLEVGNFNIVHFEKDQEQKEDQEGEGEGVVSGGVIQLQDDPAARINWFIEGLYEYDTYNEKINSYQIIFDQRELEHALASVRSRTEGVEDNDLVNRFYFQKYLNFIDWTNLDTVEMEWAQYRDNQHIRTMYQTLPTVDPLNPWIGKEIRGMLLVPYDPWIMQRRYELIQLLHQIERSGLSLNQVLNGPDEIDSDGDPLDFDDAKNQVIADVRGQFVSWVQHYRVFFGIRVRSIDSSSKDLLCESFNKIADHMVGLGFRFMIERKRNGPTRYSIISLVDDNQIFFVRKMRNPDRTMLKYLPCFQQQTPTCRDDKNRYHSSSMICDAEHQFAYRQQQKGPLRSHVNKKHELSHTETREPVGICMRNKKLSCKKKIHLFSLLMG